MRSNVCCVTLRGGRERAKQRCNARHEPPRLHSIMKSGKYNDLTKINYYSIYEMIKSIIYSFIFYRVDFAKLVHHIDEHANLILAIATGALVWIAIGQWRVLDHTDITLHETLIASNRAWITPLGVEAIDSDNSIRIRIQYKEYCNKDGSTFQPPIRPHPH
jgi:hypothetical protein